MSKLKDKTSEEGFLQKLWKESERFWPVSVLLMAFTILSSVDEIETFSKYLSQFLKEWRLFLNWIFEFPLNVILKIFGIKPISIMSPIPETLVVLGLLAFTSLRSNQLQRSKIVLKGEAGYAKLVSFLLKPFDKFQDNVWVELLIFVVSSLMRILTLLVPSGIIGVILFREFLNLENFSIFESVLLLGLLPAVPLFLAELFFKVSEDTSTRILDLHFKFILPLVIILAFSTVVFVTALEFVVVDFMDFSKRAKNP